MAVTTARPHGRAMSAIATDPNLDEVSHESSLAFEADTLGSVGNSVTAPSTGP
jgi:hypothetical protein